MNCTKASQLLQLYMDDQLSSSQVHMLETHVRSCSFCTQEWRTLDMIRSALTQIEQVSEPQYLAKQIMQRVAFTPQEHADNAFALFRPSLSELLTVVILATATTFGVILAQPSLRDTLAFTNLPDFILQAIFPIGVFFSSLNGSTLLILLWIVGTALGIWITFVLAGKEVRRTEWFRSVIARVRS